MNSQLKKRLIIGTVVIVAVVVALVLFVGGSSSAKSISIAQSQQADLVGKKVQVQGNVVNNSYQFSDKTVTFSIYDPEDATASPLVVVYDGAVSATFGNGVTAICTGKMDEQGRLIASELVTKCPSKYESSSDALSIEKLVGYGDSIYDKVVKVTGVIKSGTLNVSAATKTFVLFEQASAQTLSVSFAGALGDGIAEGSSVVLTGSLASNGIFTASEVALAK